MEAQVEEGFSLQKEKRFAIDIDVRPLARPSVHPATTSQQLGQSDSLSLKRAVPRAFFFIPFCHYHLYSPYFFVFFQILVMSARIEPGVAYPVSIGRTFNNDTSDDLASFHALHCALLSLPVSII